MRIYYRGDESNIAHPGLHGVELAYGGAVDVHNDALAEQLLALEWFVAEPPTGEPVPVVYEVVEQTPEEGSADEPELSPVVDEQDDEDEEDL